MKTMKTFVIKVVIHERSNMQETFVMEAEDIDGIKKQLFKLIPRMCEDTAYDFIANTIDDEADGIFQKLEIYEVAQKVDQKTVDLLERDFIADFISKSEQDQKEQDERKIRERRETWERLNTEFGNDKK